MRRAAFASVVVALAAACTTAGTTEPAADDVIEVFGPWRETDADHFGAVLDAFAETNGLDVRYVGSVDFVADLLDRIGERNDPPDIAMIPQPALVRRLANDGEIVPIASFVGDLLEENFGPQGLALGEVDGASYSVPFRVSLKSLVWYRPDVFEERGWSVPTSLDELGALVDGVQADGEMAPWCLGLNAGSATGWAATDWTEDLVLRTAGPETYQQWVEGTIGFADPAIADAFAAFRSLVLEPGRTGGDRAAIIETPVDEAILPLLSNPPGCALHRQADFAASWIADGTEIGPDGDVDVFILPGTTDEPPPLLVGGTQAVQFGTDDASTRLMAHLASEEAAAIWAGRGGFLSLNQSVADDAYRDAYLRDLTAAIRAAPAVVFDASDQMPPEIGTDLLWDRITAWVAGTDDYPTFAAALDEARVAHRGSDSSNS